MAVDATDLAVADARAEGCPPLHKDFYLRHPEPVLQCAKYCWGNLEEAHPVIGARSEEEVAEYRRQHGIHVEAVRGRKPPKPFQLFSETSFPDFVEDLAYELFTTEAKPFPVQAQVWPCALAGADVIAVAPTGSGKTLAFLLPALVHMIAQEELQEGDGPITLVFAPTRELVQQTGAVARRFCERTRAPDILRVGSVFGGVDPSIQVPVKGEPDGGRWPELLIATPGRFLELCRRCWLKTTRVSFVVLDEADDLLSARPWLPQIQAALGIIRPDRQLLMLSATLSPESEALGRDLAGDELMVVRVLPEVPSIPQAVRLFPGSDSYAERRAALLDLLRHGSAPNEALLVLCSGTPAAKALAEDGEIADAARGEVALFQGNAVNEQRRAAYWRFVRGEARVLFASSALASRGLDYSDTAAGVGDEQSWAPLSLVVVIFDFPPTIRDYAHCIGRTQRPGQRSGRTVTFLPELRFWLARELLVLLERCGQAVPEELRRLVSEDRAFVDDAREALLLLKQGEAPCLPDAVAPASAFCGGDFDEAAGVWRLPASLPSYRRRLLHGLADEVGLAHVSYGCGPEGRRLHVALAREALPDKFFMEGEEVLVAASVRPAGAGGRGKGAAYRGARPLHDLGTERRAVVVDPRVHPSRRTLTVRFADANCLAPVDVCVEAVRLAGAAAE